MALPIAACAAVMEANSLGVDTAIIDKSGKAAAVSAFGLMLNACDANGRPTGG